MVEGKLKIWIRGGSFQFRNDLYVKVLCDTREVWNTDESDSFSPSWDSTCVKHIKGDYEKLIFRLMDEDTFNRDDLLGTFEIAFSDIESGPVAGEFEMLDANGESIGIIDLSVEYEEGDVNFFQLMSSRIHTDD